MMKKSQLKKKNYDFKMIEWMFIFWTNYLSLGCVLIVFLVYVSKQIANSIVIVKNRKKTLEKKIIWTSIWKFQKNI